MQPLAATSYTYWKIISSGGILFDVFCRRWFRQTCSLIQSTAVFSVNTTLPAESRPGRLWMCFRKQSHTYKYRAFRHLRRQKARFRQMANHRKTLYSSRFSGAYLFFTFCINTTHSTCVGCGIGRQISIIIFLFFNLLMHFTLHSI